MKITRTSVLFASIVMFSISCKKDPVENCSTCDGPNVANSFDVCEEEGRLFVDGEEIPNENNITLEQLIKGLEDNITDEEAFENLSCR